MIAALNGPVPPLDAQVDQLFTAIEARDLAGFGTALSDIARTAAAHPARRGPDRGPAASTPR
jgi:hypothetical protein